jgi:hypothetical protein
VKTVECERRLVHYWTSYGKDKFMGFTPCGLLFPAILSNDSPGAFVTCILCVDADVKDDALKATDAFLTNYKVPGENRR